MLKSKFGGAAVVAAPMGKAPASLTEDDALKVLSMPTRCRSAAASWQSGSITVFRMTPITRASAQRWAGTRWTKASDPVATVHACSARRLSSLEALS